MKLARNPGARFGNSYLSPVEWFIRQLAIRLPGFWEANWGRNLILQTFSENAKKEKVQKKVVSEPEFDQKVARCFIDADFS